MQITKHFAYSEFKCPCGVCDTEVDFGFVGKLEAIRVAIGLPMVVSKGGGCRCKDYNDATCGATDSMHMPQLSLGSLAADIKCYNAAFRYLLVEEACAIGLGGIGIYPHHVHLDDRLKIKRTKHLWIGSYS